MRLSWAICDRYGNEIKKSGYEENAYAAFSFFISLPK